jgi:SAM-dependent methyltransferase
MSLRTIYNAFVVTHASRHIEKQLSERKRRLFAGLTGRVVELGPGSGANFPYLPTFIDWSGVEPNKELQQVLRKRSDLPRMFAVHEPGFNDSLPFLTKTIDHVICTFVLCSVNDPVKTLEETYRILKPGGTFRFMEHVAAPSGTCACVLQNISTPFTKVLFGNCRTNRRTGALIQKAGFTSVETEASVFRQRVRAASTLPFRALPENS